MNTQQSFKIQDDYYFIGPDGKPGVAKKSNLLKHYKNKKEKLQAYIDENKVDFSKESDLMRLMEFCQTH